MIIGAPWHSLVTHPTHHAVYYVLPVVGVEVRHHSLGDDIAHPTIVMMYIMSYQMLS